MTKRNEYSQMRLMKHEARTLTAIAKNHNLRGRRAALVWLIQERYRLYEELKGWKASSRAQVKDRHRLEDEVNELHKDNTQFAADAKATEQELERVRYELDVAEDRYGNACRLNQKQDEKNKRLAKERNEAIAQGNREASKREAAEQIITDSRKQLRLAGHETHLPSQMPQGIEALVMERNGARFANRDERIRREDLQFELASRNASCNNWKFATLTLAISVIGLVIGYVGGAF